MQLRKTMTAAGSILILATAADPALAYMGPGLGLGAIGTALGVLGAILLGIVSMVWYPLKRLARRLRKRLRARAAGADEPSAS